ATAGTFADPPPTHIRSTAFPIPSIHPVPRNGLGRCLTFCHGLVRFARPVVRDMLPLGDGPPLLRRRHHHEFIQLREEIPSGFLRQRRKSKQQPEHLSHIAHGLTLPSSVEITRHLC